ncbi:succinate dehydrogenase, cytochrome b556 subunit [Pneumocystis murina B123]|uniref:Succinate dehydrogenase, cytochrome b556 subunit n=1 Tax=Pneumocystis murina (strain B123) TaxID=1069680 RepID=M7PIK9_PNEMU|nr:succinate dehydrogenase, cytochrome b556 subunit [Pneumocystis murina B123]EMR10269.1 succinate dehydrogenase, cytochrome b556 subunit [Pneumocystis murina B123]
MSGFNRITGCFVSAGLYVFAISYLVSSIFNWHLDSETISSIFHAWPVEAKVLTKFIVSFPFTYHSFNGLRHLYWDTGRGLTLKGVYTTGYIVIGLSTVSSIILSLI